MDPPLDASTQQNDEDLETEQNGNESCLIVEENISTIVIDDSIVIEDINEDGELNESDNELVIDSADMDVVVIGEDFQVVDQVGTFGSQEQNVEVDLERNGNGDDVSIDHYHNASCFINSLLGQKRGEHFTTS